MIRKRERGARDNEGLETKGREDFNKRRFEGAALGDEALWMSIGGNYRRTKKSMNARISGIVSSIYCGDPIRRREAALQASSLRDVDKMHRSSSLPRNESRRSAGWSKWR